MPNKTNKFGIKFWLLVDTKSKYLVIGFPYLCKDDERPESMQLPEYVVKRIMVELVLNKGILHAIIFLQAKRFVITC